MRLRIVVAVIVAGAAIAFVFLLLRPSRSAQQSKLGSAAPSSLIAPRQRRVLPSLSGSALRPPPGRLPLRASRSRPGLVDVWASWCVPCKEEAPTLTALDRRYGQRIRFIGVNVEDTKADARAFERRYRIRYPSIYDEQASMATELGFFGLPTLFLVDSRSRIAAVLIGKQKPAILIAKVKRLASEAEKRRRR